MRKLFFALLVLQTSFSFAQSQFNFNSLNQGVAADITTTFNSAIANPSITTIYFDNVPGVTWKCKQLNLKSNLSIVFAANAKLEAVPGGFSTGGVLFNLNQLQNVSITGGTNSSIKMLIAEYNDGEWRHCINMLSCTNITVSGISLLDSGGDGIYLGVSSATAPPCSTIVVTNVICDAHARQGISIISANNVTIDGCTFSNTGSKNHHQLAVNGPFAGIDFEPNAAGQVLTNITVKNSKFFGNRVGILYAFGCNSNSITIQNNNIYDNNKDGLSSGIQFFGAQRGTTGSFSVTNNKIYGNHIHPIQFTNWNYTNALITMDNNEITATAVTETPIYFYLDANQTSTYYGGITATNTNFIGVGTKPHVLFTGGAATRMYKNINIAGFSDSKVLKRKYNNFYENVKVVLRRPYLESVFFDNFVGNTEPVIGGLPKDVFFTSPLAKIYMGDYNGDGRTDLFVKGYSTWRGLFLAKQDGSAGFTMAFGSYADDVGGTDSDAFLTDPAAQVYPGDYNGDGKTDLFVKGYGTWRALYLSTGSGFTKAFQSNADGEGGTDSEGFLTDPSALVFPGDYNGDGKTDLFVKGYGTYRALYTSNGTTFTRQFMSNADGVGGTDSEGFLTDPTALVFTGDYNGDGKTDLFVKGYGTYRALYYSIGNSFNREFMSDLDNVGGTDGEVFLTDPSALVFTGDYNADGRTDFFIKGYGTWRAMYISNGYSATGAYFTRTLLGSTADAGGTDVDNFFTSPDAKIYTGDYNGDGSTDLFVKGYSNWRGLYLSNITGDGFNPIFGDFADGAGGTDSEPFFTDPTALVFPGDFFGNLKTQLLIKGYGTYRACYGSYTGGTPRLALPSVQCEGLFTGTYGTPRFVGNARLVGVGR